MPTCDQERCAHYRAYLLRLWRSETRAGDGWRASLEDLHMGERVGFAGLEELFSFLIASVESEIRRAAELAAEEPLPLE